MVKLRRLIHRFPEGGFKEFKTQKTLRDKLLSFGIKESEIRESAGTGLIVDLKGTGPEVKEEKD